MKRNAGKLIAVLLAAVLGLLSFTGCVNEAGKTDADTVAAVFEGEKINLDEVKLYVYACEYDIEKLSEAMIGAMYGSFQAFWEVEENGSNYWEYNRSTAMGQMLQTKILVKYAEKEGIKLSADEQAKVDEAVKTFQSEREAVVKAAGANEALVKKFVTENAIAVRAYQKITEDIDTSYDEAAMKRSNVVGVTVVAQSEYTPADADESEKIEYSEEEQEENREQVLAEVLEKIQGGAEISDVVEEYTGNEKVAVYSLGTLKISEEDAPEDGAEITGYKQEAYMMKTGDVISCVYNNSNNKPIGYVLRCVNDDDPDLKQEAINTELGQRRQDKFAEDYTALTKKYDRFHVYSDYVNAVAFQGSLFESDIVPAVPTAAE